jgi:hypothetical protein
LQNRCFPPLNAKYRDPWTMRLLVNQYYSIAILLISVSIKRNKYPKVYISNPVEQM